MHYRLHARIKTPAYDLINVAMPCYRKKRVEQWYVKTDEIETPRGFPIRIYAWIGANDDQVVIESGKAILLSVGPLGPPFCTWVELLLPTDEILAVAVEQHLEPVQSQITSNHTRPNG